MKRIKSESLLFLYNYCFYNFRYETKTMKPGRLFTYSYLKKAYFFIDVGVFSTCIRVLNISLYSDYRLNKYIFSFC
jgi:hypothetical protein